jgi:hypothetical protein
MSFAELKKEVLRMSDSQREKLMNILLGIRSQHGDKWLAEMERRRRKAKRGESLSRVQVMKKHGIDEKEISTEANWWKRGNGS